MVALGRGLHEHEVADVKLEVRRRGNRQPRGLAKPDADEKVMSWAPSYAARRASRLSRTSEGDGAARHCSRSDPRLPQSSIVARI